MKNIMVSAFHPQFKLYCLKDSVKIKVITARMNKLGTKKERLHAERNTHRIIEEEGEETSVIFAALHWKSSLNDKVGKTNKHVSGNSLSKVTANKGFISWQGLSTHSLKRQYCPSTHFRC